MIREAGLHLSAGAKPTGPARRVPRPGVFSALGLADRGLMLLPLAYLVLRAASGRFRHGAGPDSAPAHRPAAAQHRGAVAGVLALHRDRAAAGLAGQPHRPAGRRLINVLAVLPLAVPGYVMAYALIGLSGNYGFLNQVFGVTMPRLQGLWGATLALALYTFPYLYLNLRAAFAGLDQAWRKPPARWAASPREVFFRVTLPHLMPALMAGWLVIGLYVIGDFGAVALMRFEAFSYAIYQQYSAAFDRLYAAWLALILIAIALSVVWWESRLREGAHYARTGSGSGAARLRAGPRARRRLGFVGLVVLASMGLPVAVLAFWMTRSRPLWPVLPALMRAFRQSLSVACPAACWRRPWRCRWRCWPCATRRGCHASSTGWPSSATRCPALAFALAFVFFSLQGARWLYQTHRAAGHGLCAQLSGAGAGADPLGALSGPPLGRGIGPRAGSRPFATFWRVTLPASAPAWWPAWCWSSSSP
jgi:iron(III) transport system permease protein